MKTKLPLLIFFLLGIGPFFSLAQFDFDAYSKYRDAVSSFDYTDLENYYPRPSATYYKGYNNTPELSAVLYFDSIKSKLQLTEDEIDLLTQNHFMITERLSRNSFETALTEIFENDLPVFISSDIILHALHTSYNFVLMRLERQLLCQNLENYIRELYLDYPRLYNKYRNQNIDESLKDIDLYIAVAYSLITDENHQPQSQSPGSYTAIMEMIEAEAAAEVSLFTRTDRKRWIDFSQFTVRGHYVYHEEDAWMGYTTLEPYFRAMMWLSKTEFYLTKPEDNPWGETWGKEEIRRMNIDAYLLNELNQMNGYLNDFQTNESTIEFMVGESDNITPSEYNTYLKSMSITSAVQLKGDELYDAYYEGLKTNPAFEQKLLGSMMYSNNNAEQPTELPVTFYLSGQRFVIDSYVFSNVVYDKTKTKRMMPNPLDVLYSLGNSDSGYLLKDEIERYAYAPNLANMRYLIDKKGDDFWSASFYNSWLSGIRELTPGEVNEDHPFFQNTSAWHHQKMNTQLASWAQLRHDNLLYAKQSYSGMVGCSYPFGYVEPVPEFYDVLINFSNAATTYFEELGFNYFSNYYDNFARLLEKLKLIAEKELMNEKFTNEEIKWLQSFLIKNENDECGLPPNSGWFYDLFLDVENGTKEDFIIADVHTQPTDEAGSMVGRVLHVGVGQINQGVIIAQDPGSQQYVAYCAPFMSYYEKVSSNFERLTDEVWGEQVLLDDVPKRPVWTNSYLLNANGNKNEVELELPYSYFVGVPEIEIKQDVWKVYPNPVKDLLFIKGPGLSEVLSCSIVHFDGRRIAEIELHEDQIIDFSSLKKGVYLLQIRSANNLQTFRIIKE